MGQDLSCTGGPRMPIEPDELVNYKHTTKVNHALIEGLVAGGEEPIFLYMNEWTTTSKATNDVEGVGEESILTVTDGGDNPVMSITVPPRRSWGKVTIVRDKTGEKIKAALRSGGEARPKAGDASTFEIYGNKPSQHIKHAGSASTQEVGLTVEGNDMYLWATLTRKPFSKPAMMATVADKEWKVKGTVEKKPRFTVMIGSETFAMSGKAEVAKTSEYCIMPGADAALVICLTVAHQLLLDEVESVKKK